MKKTLLAIVVLSVWVGTALAQYPHVTISQIQQVPMDSLLIADTLSGFSANSAQARWTLQTSPYNGDTVIVTGIVLVPPMVISYTASGWTMVLYDTSAAGQQEWGGILVRANIADSTALVQAGFLSVSPGDTITMTGVISEFPASRGFSATQIQPIASQPMEIGSAPGPVPQPVVKQVADFYKGIFSAGTIQYSTGEPFEGMYVELHNLTIDNNSVNATRGTFSAVDASGNEISEYDWSRYFALGTQSGWSIADTAWQRIFPTLAIGMRIDTLRGIISTASGSEGPRGYRISPIYYSDLVLSPLPTPPLVTTHRRNPVVVTPDTTANISVKVTQQNEGTPAKTVTLYYSKDFAPFVSLAMSFQASDTTYIAQIPKEPAGSVMRYFFQAKDSLNQTVLYANSATTGAASDTSKGFFFYAVVNGPLSIHDVQYTPYVNGRSAYLGAITQLGGIITADTSNLILTPTGSGGTNAWYMQSSNLPWSGIWLTTADTTGQQLMGALRNGDSVLVTGTVQENFDVTRLGAISAVTKVSSGNAVPAPVPLTTGAFNVGNGNPSAEPYEGMLVRFTNVAVSDTNPTFSDQTEYSVNDGTGAVIVRRDGKNKYSNQAVDAAFGKTILRVGDRISSLTGIIHYSFNQYKVVPRTDADFGSVTGVEQQPFNAGPLTFSLLQNYPNPFNPTTTIRYELAAAGQVSLRVYNLLGQEVATLVDGVQTAGHYSVRLNGAPLATGVYFYRLQTSKFVAVKKMLLVK
ncbi:MAG: T9SS type A sorting domain-containing protein [Bacteroidota bacterium]